MEILMRQLDHLASSADAEVVMLAEGVSYDFLKAELNIRGECQGLSGLESRIFGVLCKNRNKLSGREVLLQAGWGNAEVQFETQLNKVICRLRKMLEKTEKVEIVADKGNGYWMKGG